MTDASGWGNKRRILMDSIRMLGFWMTLRYWLIYRLSYKPEKDRSFDRRHRTDTGGLVRSDELGIADDATERQANLFLGSPARVTRYMLRALDIDYRNFIFIDYGSGKGRTLMVAAEFPFSKVVGVEISDSLHRTAERNLANYRSRRRQCRDIELFCGDARGFALPDSDLVLHMYHPFGQDVLRDVLTHIRASVREYPSRVLIPYLFSVAMAKSVFEEFPEFRRVRDVLCVNNQYRWTLYEYDRSDRR